MVIIGCHIQVILFGCWAKITLTGLAFAVNAHGKRWNKNHSKHFCF
jgi:hypothetical protein